MTFKELYEVNNGWKPKTTICISLVNRERCVVVRCSEMLAFDAKLIYRDNEVITFENDHIFMYDQCRP